MASEWRTSLLGEITTTFDGMRKPVRETDRRRGGYPYYGASGIVDYVDGYLFDGDYLLIAEDGENLRTRQTPIAFMARGRFWVNNHAHIVTGNSKADTRFLMYAIRNTDIDGYLTGAVMPKLTQGNLHRIAIHHPPLPEQRAIAHILGTLDDKIELNRQMSATLEAMARALFESWFVRFDPVRAKAEGRDTGLPADIAALFPDSFEQSEIGEVPKGWSWGTVADLCRAVYSGGTPSTKVAAFWNGDVPWLSSGETRETFVIDTEKRISVEGVSQSSTRHARRLSTVIASAGQGNTRGQTSLLGIDCYVNQSVVVLAANELTSSPFHLFFNLERRYEEFRQVSDGHSSRGSLTTRLLAELKAICPSPHVVAAFDSFVAPLVDRVFGVLSESRDLTSLRDTLLPKLISGELRVPDAERALATAGVS